MPETLSIDSVQVEAFDPKLTVPAVRRGAVVRTPLVNRLRAAAGTPVVVLVAPAGYGKTTLLSQWSMRDKRPFAWLALDEGDNDPDTLTASLAGALDLPRGGRGGALPGALSALGPIVLVLDDIHLLRARACVEAVTTLVPYLPSGSTLVLSGRSAARLRLARLRAEGALFELGRDDFAMSDREAAVVVRDAGVDIDAGAVAELNHRTEGWAAGLYLAALSLRDGSGAEPGGFHGDDRFVTDYIRSEYLADVDPQDVSFLTRTSILVELTGPLCDAVLERHDSARRLEAFEGSSQLVVPLDHHRERYRYNRLFREVFRSELELREPTLVPELHRRAADWLEEHGRLECALDHVNELGDTDRAARLTETLAMPAYFAGRIDTVERWLGRFDLPWLTRRPAVAILGAWIHAVRGRAADAECWLDAARKAPARSPLPDGTLSTKPWIALLDAAMCPDGVDRMGRDADVAARGLAPGSPLSAAALLLQGIAQSLAGKPGADDVLADAVATARAVGATNSEGLALVQRALLAEAAGDENLAESLAYEARALVVEHGLAGYSTSAGAFAASARIALRRGDWEHARADLAGSGEARPAAHAGAALALGADAGGARTHAPRDPGRRGRPPPARTGVRDPAPAAGARQPHGGGERPPPAARHRRSREPEAQAFEPDGGGAAPVAAACDPSLVPRDRRAAVRVAQHGQDPGDLRLPEVRRLEPERGDRPGRGARPRRCLAEPVGRLTHRAADRQSGRCEHPVSRMENLLQTR